MLHRLRARDSGGPSPRAIGPDVAPYDARTIANYLLDLASEAGRPLTQMAILKLIYFAHGWYLATKNHALVMQPFEAWKYGPVLKVVRDAFKEYADRPIESRARAFDLISGESFEVCPKIQEGDADFLRGIFQEYAGIDAWTLSNITHEPGSPWDQIWNSRDATGRLALRLRNEDIRLHFLARSRSQMVS